MNKAWSNLLWVLVVVIALVLLGWVFLVPQEGNISPPKAGDSAMDTPPTDQAEMSKEQKPVDDGNWSDAMVEVCRIMAQDNYRKACGKCAKDYDPVKNSAGYRDCLKRAQNTYKTTLAGCESHR